MLHALIVRLKLALVLVFAQVCLVPTSWASNEPAWPTKQVTLVVPYPPGAITDTVGRRLGNQLSAALNVPVVIENKPGAGANLGAAFVSNAQPNGATILFTSYGNIMIDSVTEAQHKLTPVAAVGPMTVAMMMRKHLLYKTIEELVAYARANPQKISFASVGIGSSYHLLIEQMNTLGKLDMVHIPYKGAGSLMPHLMSGQVDLAFPNLPTGVSLVEQGQLRALGVTTATRSNAAPTIPTIAEAGVPNYDMSTWYGLVGPADLPAPVLKKLTDALAQTMNDPEFRSRLVTQGMDPKGSSPAEFTKFIQAESARWAAILKEMNVSAN